MEYSPPSKTSMTSDSSSESIAESTLKTPLDPSPPSTYIPSKSTMHPSKQFSSRLELLPKRTSGTLLDSQDAWTKAHPPRRERRPTIESVTSMTSHSSNRSLLRTTLLLVTSSSRPSSRPYSALATAQTSVSSLASTSQTSRGASQRSSSHVSYENDPTFAAEPTTALAPLSSNSLAQFSTVPAASASLLQFGISPARTQSMGNVNSDKPRRRRSRDARKAFDERSSSVSSPKQSTPPTSWLGFGATSRSLNPQQPLLAPPSISRALVPDEDEPASNLGDSNGLNIPGTWDRILVPGQGGQDIVSTPRPVFPIESKPWTWEDKGKGKVHAPGIAPTLQRTSSAPVPATKTKVDSRLQPAAASVLRPSNRGYDSNLPSLAAIESNSRLMRSKIVCATCNEVGPDFPRCGRCGEAWCSRECRVEANKPSGGKHRCSPSVA